MEILSTIIAIVIIYIVIDIYFRIASLRRYVRYLLLSNEIINKILTAKGVVKKEDIESARKDSLDKMYVGDYKSLKRDLKKINIDIDK